MDRLWQAEGLRVTPRRGKRRRVGAVDGGIERRTATMSRKVCGLDFIHDATLGG
jgi:hypothetical protein